MSEEKRTESFSEAEMRIIVAALIHYRHTVKTQQKGFKMTAGLQSTIVTMIDTILKSKMPYLKRLHIFNPLKLKSDKRT